MNLFHKTTFADQVADLFRHLATKGISAYGWDDRNSYWQFQARKGGDVITVFYDARDSVLDISRWVRGEWKRESVHPLEGTHEQNSAYIEALRVSKLLKDEKTDDKTSS